MVFALMIAACTKDAPGAIVEKAMNDMINGNYEAFMDACDLGEDSLPSDQVKQGKELAISMLKKTIDGIKQGNDEEAKKKLPKRCKVLDEHIDGDNAVVEIEITSVGGDSSYSKIQLKKNNAGTWKITNSNDIMPQAPAADLDYLNEDDSDEDDSDEDNYLFGGVDEDSDENELYSGNSLSTGTVPYICSGLYGDESAITVTTSGTSGSDVVVMLKMAGRLVRNAYIQAGDSYTFNLPNGRYQVFFYGGSGWNPNKIMPDGSSGGFVEDESFTKDLPADLEFQELTYELILQPNGNFNALQSSASEMF